MSDAREEVPFEQFERDDNDGTDMGVFLDAVFKDGKGWWEAQKAYTTLVVSERFGKLAGMLMSTIVVVLLVIGVLIMFSLALGIWLGEMMDHMPLGFLCVAGIHLIIILCFLLFGRKFVRDLMTLHIINAINAKD